MSDFLKKIRPLILERVQNAHMTMTQMESAFEHQPHDFGACFQDPGKNIIAEIKRASPSQGEIAPNKKPVEVAQSYLHAGAKAISVLTEPHYFGGNIAFIKAIRQAYPEARLLMKDFIITEHQVVQARWAGADACLLMVSMLEHRALKTLFDKALELGLTPLVEVHDADELKIALDLDAPLIGINNRDLKTLKVDLSTGKNLLEKAPKDRLYICESGIHQLSDLNLAHQWGFNGFLIGTHFMRQSDPGAALKAFLENNDAG